MIENFPPEAKGGAYVGILWLGYAILRVVGLRASKDAITLKTDAAERSGIEMLEKRVKSLDKRVNELESVRNHLFGFGAKCMAYVSQCQCEGINPPTKADIQAEYARLIIALAGPIEENKEH